MLVFHHPDCLAHNPPTEILSGKPVPYKESPDRLRIVKDALQADHARYDLAQVPDFDVEPYILKVHTAEYLEYLRTAYDRWCAEGGDKDGVLPECFPHPQLHANITDPSDMGAIARAGYYCFDLSCPITSDTFKAVIASAKVAVHAAEQLLTLEPQASSTPGIFALTRPPGHHAAKELSGGYCYVNNAVVAARAIQHISPGTRVAILDIDYHHGNGTQSLTYDDPSVFYASLHAKGDYPYFTGSTTERGSGEAVGTNLNIPLPMNATGDDEYLVALNQATESIQSYAPAVLLVSLGLDTYCEDPICTFGITTPAYSRIGAKISELGLPTLFLFEGGYFLPALGANVKGVLDGFQDARK